VIPKLYNGKDRTFFFFSYERYKEDQALTFTDTLPNAAYQAGRAKYSRKFGADRCRFPLSRPSFP